MNIPRPEHPRPDFYRPQWLNLNGTWEFEFHGTYPLDPLNIELSQSWSKEITVPFPYQSPLSGIGYKGIQPCVWYRRSFDIPKEWEGKRTLLHFGAVDYLASVWLNGTFIGQHRGGHVPFSFDITRYTREQDNTLIVKVIDKLDLDQPRGKQSWADPVACWYTQTTGIWQTVWLEAVSDHYIESARIVPDLDDGSVNIIARPNMPSQGFEISVEATFEGILMGTATRKAAYPATSLRIELDDVLPWNPETPNLYDLKITLTEGKTVVDTVETYLGMRKISLSEGSLLLNDKPYYQRLVLDQGFWPDGLYTPPTDEALKIDIELAKKMGFNGCRKHMKVEDPRFLYWADRLGFLVWGEFPASYEFSLSSQAKFLPEWQAAIERDINHPSIIAWTPLNESWGIKDIGHDPETQRWVSEVVKMTRLIDPTRLVIDNDGWEHVVSDIYGYHDYAASGETLKENYDSICSGENKKLLCGDHTKAMMADGIPLPPNMPLMLTEFGGIGFIVGDIPSDAWGYANIPKTDEEFKARYEETLQATLQLSGLCGYVYTQLTDVEQEINGLLTADRTPKFDVDWLRKVNTGEVE